MSAHVVCEGILKHFVELVSSQGRFELRKGNDRLAASSGSETSNGDVFVTSREALVEEAFLVVCMTARCRVGFSNLTPTDSTG